jgi:hypothetical protein
MPPAAASRLARLGLASAVVAALLLAGCRASGPGSGGRGPAPALPPSPEGASGPPPADIISGVATVSYVNLEGGFYGLVTDDERRLVPDTLAERFRRDGLRVRFRAVRLDSTFSIRMWGQPIDLLDIARVSVE